MKENLTAFGIIIALCSIVAFFIGFIMFIFGKDKKAGIKVILTAIISFIIGFGTCLTNMGPLNMH